MQKMMDQEDPKEGTKRVDAARGPPILPQARP